VWSLYYSFMCVGWFAESTHVFVDLPILVRARYANNVSAFDLNEAMPGHVDIPRLREGKVGGFFWWVRRFVFVRLVVLNDCAFTTGLCS
jgi:hypothetical protein